MKLKYLFSSPLLVTFFFLCASVVFANDCEIAEVFSSPSNPQTLDARVCIGGFEDRVSANQPMNMAVTCEGKSVGLGDITTDICGVSQSQVVFANPIKVADDGRGGYYTCFDVQELNRDVGKITATFTSLTGQQMCKTEPFNSVPANYTLTERIVSQVSNSGYNTGQYTGNSPYCAGEKEVNTALGCISFNAEGGGFVRSLLGVIIGLGGGVALLLILYGVFIVTTSAGIPDKLNSGKEIISSAVAGLVFIILAIFLMNLIGIRILALPGLE